VPYNDEDCAEVVSSGHGINPGVNRVDYVTGRAPGTSPELTIRVNHDITESTIVYFKASSFLGKSVVTSIIFLGKSTCGEETVSLIDPTQTLSYSFQQGSLDDDDE